ncbi:MAG TPA: hypothetical protein VF004_04790 [Burkholderiales bacterium]
MKTLLAILFLSFACVAQAQQKDMTFFITSAGPGKGADLGGLKGADGHCQSLAKSAGAGNRQWRAYLSTDKVNARDRIGKGPWKNAKGEVIAKDLDDLHKNPRIDKQHGLDEKGQPVNGRGDSPNRHDILTGSTPEGRAIADKDMSCGNWTKSGEGSAMVGHHDRIGLRDDDESKSWNSSHPSRGCGQDALRSSGGDGLLYCFAVK